MCNFFLCFPLQPTVPFSSSDRPWQRDPSASSRSSLFCNSLLSVNSLFLFSFFFNIKFILGLCSICVWVMGKQWKRGRKVKLISGLWCFYVLCLNFSSCSSRLFLDFCVEIIIFRQQVFIFIFIFIFKESIKFQTFSSVSI